MTASEQSMNPETAGATDGDGPAAPAPVQERSPTDRRRRPTSPWWALPPAGARTRNRRAAEHRLAYFVDRFPPATLILILLLLLATLLDAVLTLTLLNAGGEELNPLMGRLLDHGVLAFLLGKYVLTAGGLPLLLIFKNFYLFGTRIRVGHLIPALVALYAVLIAYQLWLLYPYLGF
jgi:hypothetical protein